MKFASRNRDAVQGLALGHACLSFSADADPPAITRTLVAEHDPCLLFTKDGYEAAVSAFPGAMRVTCREKPSVSMTFAEAMRDFYREVVS